MSTHFLEPENRGFTLLAAYFIDCTAVTDTVAEDMDKKFSLVHELRDYMGKTGRPERAAETLEMMRGIVGGRCRGCEKRAQEEACR